MISLDSRGASDAGRSGASRVAHVSDSFGDAFGVTRIAACLLALILVWAPLPFGSVTRQAEFWLQVALSLVLLLVGVAGDASSARPVLVPALAVGGIVALGLAQAAAWPQGLATFLSSEHAALTTSAGDLLGNQGPRVPLSVAPSASLTAALSWATAAVTLLLAAAVGPDVRNRRLIAGGIVAGALFQLIYGTQHWFSRARDIWGVRINSNPERLHGTFVNSNHFAVYLGLAMAVAFAWLWRALRLAHMESRPERRLLLVAPPALVWLALFAGLAFSQSRSGLIAALGGVAFQGLFIAVERRRWRLAPIGIACALVALAVVAAVGMREGLSRAFGTSIFDVSGHARIKAWVAGADLWQRFPWLGTGLGTFRDSFALVQPSAVPGTWDHAHNDLVEMLVTVGIVGTALLAVGLAALTRRLFAVLREAARGEDRAAALAALGALVTAAIHGLFDFGITMPAIAVTLAAICGAAAAPALGPRLAR